MTFVSDRMLEHMRGSQSYRDREDWPESHDLIAKIEAHRRRTGGGRHLRLTAAERAVLRSHAEMMALSARDNAGPQDPDATADLNSARAALRALEVAP